MRTVCGLLVATVVAQAADGSPAEWQAPECACRIELVETGAGRENAVFFMDLPKLGKLLGGAVDAASMRLVARGSGAAVPFSLDWRLGERPPEPGEYVRPITGYTGEKFPVAEGKLRRLGYLLFRPVAVETRYGLYFNVSRDARALRERPDPAVRAWWVEAVADPCFRVDNNRDGKPDLYGWFPRAGKDRNKWSIVPRADGTTCLQVFCTGEGSLRSQPGLLSFDRKVTGRRIVYYQHLYAEQELAGRSISITLPNALREGRASAVLYYFGKIPPKQWQELCIEGRVRSGPETPVGDMQNTYNGPCFIGETHLQFPPDRPGNAVIGCDSDVAQPGDDITLTWQPAAQSYFYRMPLAVESRDGRKWTVEGQRAEEWREGFAMEAVLATPEGKPVFQLNKTSAAGEAWTGELRLNGVSPGRYKVRFEVKSRRPMVESVARMESELRILGGPFEGKEYR